MPTRKPARISIIQYLMRLDAAAGDTSPRAVRSMDASWALLTDTDKHRLISGVYPDAQIGPYGVRKAGTVSA